MPEESKISKAQQKAVHKYVKNNYDRMELTIPKGQKAFIKCHAEKQGESMNSFVIRAIEETIERDSSIPAAKSTKSQNRAGNVAKLQESVTTPPKKQKL